MTDLFQVVPTPGRPEVFSVHGELDLSTAGRLEGALRDAKGTVELRCRDLAFIDSYGLRTLLAVEKRLVQEGGALVLADRSRALERLLEVTGLTDHFPSTR